MMTALLDPHHVGEREVILLVSTPSKTENIAVLYLHLCRHSPGADCGGITNCVDHFLDGRPCASSLDVHPVLSPSCEAEDSHSGEDFQVCFDHGCPHLQLVSSSPPKSTANHHCSRCHRLFSQTILPHTRTCEIAQRIWNNDCVW